MSALVRLRGATSISGHALRGDSLVRLVYLDNIGKSRKDHDPYLGVVGVIVNADKQYREIDLYLRDIVADVKPELAGERFVFHAMDIWHGARDFDRRTWTRNERVKLLKRLAAIPARFNLPVTYGFVDKTKFERLLTRGGRTVEMDLGAAFMLALHSNLRSVERWMVQHSDNETAMLIIESSSKIKASLRMLQRGYSRPDDEPDTTFKSTRIIDAPSIQEKQDSNMLQIADHCAFILKRKMDGKDDVEEFFEMIKPMLVHERDERDGVALVLSIKDVSPVSLSA